MKKLIAVVLLGVCGAAFAANVTVAQSQARNMHSKCGKAQWGNVAKAPDGSLISCSRGEFKPVAEQAAMLVTVRPDVSKRPTHRFTVTGYPSQGQCEADLSRSSSVIMAAYDNNVIVQARCENPK